MTVVYHDRLPCSLVQASPDKHPVPFGKVLWFRVTLHLLVRHGGYKLVQHALVRNFICQLSRCNGLYSPPTLCPG